MNVDDLRRAPQDELLSAMIDISREARVLREYDQAMSMVRHQEVMALVRIYFARKKEFDAEVA